MSCSKRSLRTTNFKINKQLNLFIMKKSFFAVAFAAVALVACNKTETVETANGMDSADVIVVDSDSTMMGMDSMNVVNPDATLENTTDATMDNTTDATMETPVTEVN